MIPQYFQKKPSLKKEHVEQSSSNVTHALVEISSMRSNSNKSSSIHCSDSGHHEEEEEEEEESSPASTPRTGSSHFNHDDHDSGILGMIEQDQDSFSSSSDSGFCLKEKNSRSSCSSSEASEELVMDLSFDKKRKEKPGLLRRHSRASSVDRREIFNKYIQRTESDNVKPFTSDDPELVCQKDRNQDEFMFDPNTRQVLEKKEFRLVRLANVGSEHLGIFIARKDHVDESNFGYFVAHIMPDGLVKR